VEALGAKRAAHGRPRPELKLIVGEPPPVPELPPQQAQARFQLVFPDASSASSPARNIRGLFLDDLQC